MARSPSARALSNTVDLYRFTGEQDPDAGLTGNPYSAAFATGVACSVQPGDPLRDLDGTTGRIFERTPYNVFFATDYSLRAHDKIAWVDNAGATRNLIVFGAADQSGKGGTIEVHAEEQL